MSVNVPITMLILWNMIVVIVSFTIGWAMAQGKWPWQ